MKRFFALLLAGMFAVAIVAPVNAHAQSSSSSKKKKKAKKAPKTKGKKRHAEESVPLQPGAPSTHGLEKMLKAEDQDTEPTRLAPASLPSRGGAITKDAKADRRRDDAIEQIKKILPKQHNPSVRADLLFQLAELWWEKSRYVKFNQEMPAFQVAADQWHQCREKKGERACGAEPRPNTRLSEALRGNAISLYQQIIKQFPDYPRLDEIRFDLAYDMADMANGTDNKREKEKLWKQAVNAYMTLIALNPHSEYVTDALVELGNYYFDHNDLNRASKAFTDAFNKHNPKTETYALYKLAWCRYNQGDYADTVKKLKEVVARSKRETSERIKLKSEALRDLVLAFSKNGERDSAIRYYQKEAGHDGAKPFIIHLANEFFTAGGAQYDDAIKTYQWLINQNPNDQYAPEWQSKIVLSYDKKSNRAQVREEIKRLVAKYGKESDWWRVNSDAHVRDLAVSLTEEALYNLVTDYHQEAIKTKSVATYTLARDIYREYIENFPDTERAYQMRFYYAEILYSLEDFQAAYEQYKKVAADDSQTQLRKIAASDMLLASEKLVDIDEGLYTKQITSDSTIIDEGKAKGAIQEQHFKEKIEKNAQVVELTPHEKQLIAACDYYTKLVPDAPDEARVRLRAAVIFFDKHQYVEAANRFGIIIQKWPEEETSRVAAGLILEALESKQEWAVLNARAREFAHNKRLLAGETKKADFKNKLNVYIEGSSFKLAAAEQGKDEAKAAEAFADFVKEFPKSKFAPIAGYNAFLIDQKEKHLDTAITLGDKIIAAYPKADSDEMRSLPGDEGKLRPKILPDLTFRLAKTYELTADYEKAAQMYERYVKQFPTEKGMMDAQFNAALWYRSLGENDNAIGAFTKYIALYKKAKPDEREELKLVPDAQVAWSICQIHEGAKEWDDFVECTDKYLKDYPHEPRCWQQINAKYKEFLAKGEQDDHDGQVDLAKYIADLYKVYLSDEDKARDTSKLAIAHTQFFLLEPEFQHYQESKFRSAAPWRMKQWLKEDLQSMTSQKKTLTEKYTEIVKYGNGDWGIAALVRIGMLPRIFANTLRNAPVPKDLDADQADMYKSQLEDKALEIETPAVDLLTTAMKKAFELGIYNEWTLKAESALAEFHPELVGSVHELPLSGSTFFFTGKSSDGASKAGSGGDQ